MLTSLRVGAAAALLTAGVVVLVAPARAAPIGGPLAIAKAPLNKAAPNMTEQVYWRGRGWGWGWGAPVAGGLIAGAVVGGALAAPYYGPGYYSGPVYYGAPAYGPPPADEDAQSYCMQRFRSYDPNTGTYLGKDGRRHPCP